MSGSVRMLDLPNHELVLRQAQDERTWSVHSRVKAPLARTCGGRSQRCTLSLDDLAGDSIFADGRPLTRAVPREQIDGGVDELRVLQQVPLRVGSRVAHIALDHEPARLSGGR